MAIHISRGAAGEWLAVQYLQEHGYQIIACNWKYQRYEIDIIASKDKILHIIEVKTRHSKAFGNPEEAVTKKKFNNLRIAAEHFQWQHPYWKRLQFDILAITRWETKADEYFLIEDVYL